VRLSFLVIDEIHNFYRSYAERMGRLLELLTRILKAHCILPLLFTARMQSMSFAVLVQSFTLLQFKFQLFIFSAFLVA